MLELVLLRSPRNWRSRERTKRQEEEVTEEPKRVTMQEVERGFSLFEEVLLAFEAQHLNIQQYAKVAATIQNAMQCSRVIYDEKTSAIPGHHWIIFFKRVDRIEFRPKPVPTTSGVSETAACPPSPIADGPSAPSSPFTLCPQSVTLLVFSLDASPCMPVVVLYFSRYCTVRLKCFLYF